LANAHAPRMQVSMAPSRNSGGTQLANVHVSASWSQLVPGAGSTSGQPSDPVPLPPEPEPEPDPPVVPEPEPCVLVFMPAPGPVDSPLLALPPEPSEGAAESGFEVLWPQADAINQIRPPAPTGRISNFIPPA